METISEWAAHGGRQLLRTHTSPVQIRVMHAAAEAPGLASSVNVGAFNLGNALGAAVGSGRLGALACPECGGTGRATSGQGGA